MKRTAMVTLVLLASVVTGGEYAPKPAAPVQTATAPGPQPVPAAAEDLDVLKLARTRRQGTRVDLFDSERPTVALAQPAIQAPAAQPKVDVPPPPPAPAAPPVPFQYLGRMQGPERTFVYLVRGQEMLVAVAGDTLGNDYRVDRISDSAVHLTYLPLNMPQVLPIPPAP